MATEKEKGDGVGNGCITGDGVGNGCLAGDSVGNGCVAGDWAAAGEAPAISLQAITTKSLSSFIVFSLFSYLFRENFPEDWKGRCKASS